jgi:cysteine-rich repeat protein
LDPTEICDDGNDDNTDGCTSTCEVYEGDAVDCLAILEQLPDSPSGLYLIDPDGDGGDAPHLTRCDMTHDGGGWTLVTIHSDDGQDTWTWNNRHVFDTNTDTFGALDGDTVVDFKSAALHDALFTDLLFVHAPSDIWAAYHGLGDGTQSLAQHIEGYEETVTWVPGTGFALSAGTLTVTGKMCDDQLYFNAADQDDNVQHHAFGPTWNARSNDACDFDDPGNSGSLGMGYGYSFTEKSALGFGQGMNLNTGEAGTGENHMKVFVRTARCGDGVVGTGEDCDDQNLDEADGCISSCEAYVAADSVDCTAILAAAPNAPEGTYLIDPDGLGGDEPISAMTPMTCPGAPRPSRVRRTWSIGPRAHGNW